MQARVSRHHRLGNNMHNNAHCDWLRCNKKRPQYFPNKDRFLLNNLKVFANSDWRQPIQVSNNGPDPDFIWNWILDLRGFGYARLPLSQLQTDLLLHALYGHSSLCPLPESSHLQKKRAYCQLHNNIDICWIRDRNHSNLVLLLILRRLGRWRNEANSFHSLGGFPSIRTMWTCFGSIRILRQNSEHHWWSSCNWYRNFGLKCSQSGVCRNHDGWNQCYEGVDRWKGKSSNVLQA